MSKEKVIKINAETFPSDLERIVENGLSTDGTVEIKSASLRDSICNYSYELLTGKTQGDAINRKGTHIVHDDLAEAFTRFNVFFAHLDDAFGIVKNTVELSELQENPETEKYHVSGFKISGVEENKSITLAAVKVLEHGRVNFDSVKVNLEGNYLFLGELLDALHSAIYEVEQYMQGKAAPRMEQIEMELSVEDNEFENAKIN